MEPDLNLSYKIKQTRILQQNVFYRLVIFAEAEEEESKYFLMGLLVCHSFWLVFAWMKYLWILITSYCRNYINTSVIFVGMVSKVLHINLAGVHLVQTFFNIRSLGCQSADFIKLPTEFKGYFQYCQDLFLRTLKN